MSERRTALQADVALVDGASRLLRARSIRAAPGVRGLPILLVPSLLQHWTILDLVPEASLAASLSEAGFDVFVLDWGELASERCLTWDEAVQRLQRMRRKVLRLTRRPALALVGYSQGATLAAVAAALEPALLAALVDIAGPIDFAVPGLLGPLTDRRWCDADALADAGGVPAGAFRAMVAVMHPGATAISAWRAVADPDPATRAHFAALEAWAADGVEVPPEILRTWLKRFYQDNALSAGKLTVAGRRVNLGAITAPTLVVTAEADTICPPAAAAALLLHVQQTTRGASRHLTVPGGHVSGIAGPGSRDTLHHPLIAWLRESQATTEAHAGA